MAGRTYDRRIQSETGDRGWLSPGGAYRGAYILDAPASRDMVGASWVYPQPTARSSGYEGELSVKPVSEWCDGSGAAPRPLKGRWALAVRVTQRRIPATAPSRRG